VVVVVGGGFAPIGIDLDFRKEFPPPLLPALFEVWVSLSEQVFACNLRVESIFSVAEQKKRENKFRLTETLCPGITDRTTGVCENKSAIRHEGREGKGG